MQTGKMSKPADFPALLRAKHGSGRRQLEAELKGRGATADALAVWLGAYDGIYRLAGTARQNEQIR